jgi:hypothetical protein
MWQGAVKRLCNRSKSCHVRKVARLLAQALSIMPGDSELSLTPTESVAASYFMIASNTKVTSQGSNSVKDTLARSATVAALHWISAQWSSVEEFLTAHDHDGAVGVPHDGVRNTAHQRPPYTPVAATPHDDQPTPRSSAKPTTSSATAPLLRWLSETFPPGT